MTIHVEIEQYAADKLSEYARSRPSLFHIGLIIAQKYEDKTYIVHLAPLPSPVAEDEGVDDENVTKQSSHSEKPDSLGSVKEASVANHARQVVRMLPGGLDVVGIYLVLPQQELNQSINQGKIKSILIAIHKITSRFYLGTKESTSDKVVLVGCTQTEKIVAKSMDLTQVGSPLDNGTLEIQGTKWIEVDYKYSLSYPVYLPKDKSSQSLSKSVLTLFKPWAKAIENSLILIDKKLFKEDNDLVPLNIEEKAVKKKHGGTKSSLDFEPPKIMKAEFLESCCPLTGVSEIQETSGSVIFSGTLVGRAFLNRKAKAIEAFDALKNDLIRSLVSRWEMHCDSLVEEPLGSTSEPVLHEPPRRVFLEGGGLPISLCDYLFPGDSVSDACQSAKELLDIFVSDENVDDSLETWTDTSVLLSAASDILFSSPSETNKQMSSTGRSNTLHLIFAIVIGFIAVGVSYFLITKSKHIS